MVGTQWILNDALCRVFLNWSYVLLLSVDPCGLGVHAYLLSLLCVSPPKQRVKRLRMCKGHVGAWL